MKYKNLSLRAREIYDVDIHGKLIRQADRMFAYLMMFQWLTAVVFAMVLSPEVWYGAKSEIHPHVYAAIILGGILSSLPIYLAFRQPGHRLNRRVIAVSQMLYSALFIHLTGGRIETHFHIFGSLALLAVYRDSEILVTASFVTLTEHLLGGIYWPVSTYGVLTATPWRALEHGGWVIFEVIFLIYSIRGAIVGMVFSAKAQAAVETSLVNVEQTVKERTEELVAAQHILVLSAKNSALGEMAGHVAHEINTPLGAITLSVQALQEKMESSIDPIELHSKLEFILKVTAKMARIVNSMRRFARNGSSDLKPVGFNEILEDTLILSEGRLKKAGVDFKLENQLPPGTLITCRSSEISQILINLLNNAIDATSELTDKRIHLKLSLRDQNVRVSISDNGSGILPENKSKLFSLQFTTKSADVGTGLGLSICKKIIEQHSGRIYLDEAQPLTTFVFELPLHSEKPIEKKAV